MDVLDKYKEVWQNQPQDDDKLSRQELYRMTQKKSSSIAKWIFIIGLIEFLFSIITIFFVDSEDIQKLFGISGEQNKIVFYCFNGLLEAMVICFVILFYVNYRKISVVENTKMLMTRIIKTRRTVKVYIYLNLLIGFVVYMYSAFHTILLKTDNHITIGVILIVVVISLFTLGIVWLFYQLLYGILLKKLRRNYQYISEIE